MLLGMSLAGVVVGARTAWSVLTMVLEEMTKVMTSEEGSVLDSMIMPNSDFGHPRNGETMIPFALEVTEEPVVVMSSEDPSVMVTVTLPPVQNGASFLEVGAT